MAKHPKPFQFKIRPIRATDPVPRVQGGPAMRPTSQPRTIHPAQERIDPWVADQGPEMDM